MPDSTPPGKVTHQLSFIENFLTSVVTPACDCGWEGEQSSDRERARAQFTAHLKDAQPGHAS